MHVERGASLGRTARALRGGARLRAMHALAWLGLVCGLCLHAAAARAFCRTTTCDPRFHECQIDARGCVTSGLPLFWPQACIAVWMPSEPDTLPGVDDATFAALTQQAFDAWREADCATGMPELQARVAGDLACIAPGYDDGHPDGVSTVTVVSDEWPHPGAFDIALTTVGFIPDSGEIRGFDIELNAAERRFTTRDRNVESDLLSTLTHEAGHALGLAHSDVRSATMFESAGSTTTLRTLDDDDVRGICSVYPPDSGSSRTCEATLGALDPDAVCDEIDARASALTRAHAGCSCEVRGGGRSTPLMQLGSSLALLIALCTRRRRARSTRR